MEETPKKLVDGNRCFICSTVIDKKDKIYIFGKSSIDFFEIIKSALDVDVRNYSAADGLFICKSRCYKSLTKYQRALDNLYRIKQDIVELFGNREARSKRCRSEDQGETRSKAVKSLPFSKATENNNATTCTSYNTQPSIQESDASFQIDEGIISMPLLSPIAPSSDLARRAFVGFPRELLQPPLITSTPVRHERATGNSTQVKVSVNYPSKTVNRSLQGSYHAIGKALAHRTPSAIAAAAMNCPLVRKHIVEKTLGLLNKELSGLCSRNNPSLLRKSGKEELSKYDLESVCDEWKNRAPLFYSFLMTSAVNRRTKASSTWFGSVAVAGSVLLKQRCEKMDATASVLGIMMKTKSAEATISRFNKLKLTNCNSNILKKLDHLGEHYDAQLVQAKECIARDNSLLKQALGEYKAILNEHCSHVKCTSACHEEIDRVIKNVRTLRANLHPGFVVSFDNIDFCVKRRNMTMDSQNSDIHWVNHQFVKNRVSGALLDNSAPTAYLPDVCNVKFLPMLEDQQRQRNNYIVLTSRVLVEYFEALQPLADACVQHIPHKYSQEMAQRTERTPLGILFKNENNNEEMLDVLKKFHTYLPTTEDGIVDGQIFSGDQLSVERAVNVIASVANGYTPADRLEGISTELGDWHAGVKLLCLIYKRFFSGKSATDSCTMFSDRSLINRRNVTSDPTSSYRPNRDFLYIVFKSRVIAAAMSALGFENKSSKPTLINLPENITSLKKVEKLELLHSLAAKVVDTFVFNSHINDLVNNVLSQQEKEDMLNRQQLTPDGRFPCRFPGCEKSFRHNGKCRRNHELSHDPPVQVDENEDEFEVSATKPPPPPVEMKEGDDVFNYNCALLEEGFLFFNFLDAVREGDGDRLMRQYKYFTLYCFSDGTHSSKYALECLFQSFQVQALLSPRDSERLVWNRFVNNHGQKGCNIPLDESTEHSNNFLKQCIRQLGPNITEEAVSRLCKAERPTTKIMAKLDETLHRVSRSGRHSEGSIERDLEELVKRLVSYKAFTEEEGRKYTHFVDFKSERLSDVDGSSLYEWINKHKKNIEMGIKAR